MFVRTLALMLATAGLMLPVSSPASATPDNYTPKAGPTFNSPVGGSRDRRAIFRKIVRSVNSTPRGSEINIFSWNFLTQEGKRALLRAQGRGVRVRLLMDIRNKTEIDNPPYRQLRAGLRKGNKGKPRARRSWARVCEDSCRGGKGKGSAHTKVFMFSEVGRADKVVIQGSANFTVASTSNQWNDIYTHRGNPAVWRFYKKVFREAARDRRADRPFLAKSFSDFRLVQFPQVGKRAPDPLKQILNRVRCKRATNTASGRTRIRIAPDVLRQNRGMQLARKVRNLWDNGCDVRIGYTIVGKDVGRMLRANTGRGPVPMKHLVQDFDGDGQFDNYFHLKAMTIVGNYGKDRSNHVLVNGSANWSSMAKVSDENVGIYYARGPVLRYQEHLDYWYENFPGDGSKSDDPSPLRRSASGADPLVFGSGDEAVYEDGTPLGYDPFAGMELN
jgi:hypothetical protein